MASNQLWKTREVMVGSVGVGGKNPIRLQSMTTTQTSNVEATLEQVMRLADAGCEIVRVTVQGMREAMACEAIKAGLIQRGYQIPLVADIHFFPAAAMQVADFVDKIRINPGNFVDKRASFKTLQLDEKSWAEELRRIEEKFAPLVEKCKKLKRALRIGVNHGSLSDRMMSAFGNTPKAMVISALEFTEVARKYDFHDLIFSMKASYPKIMIEAYRLLVLEMMKRGLDYPLHLGVTEAGEGEDGRIKSAIGIGSLLLDGIGDTLRVSLTEDPWLEIAPARRLVKMVERNGKSESDLTLLEKRLKPLLIEKPQIRKDEIEVSDDCSQWEKIKEIRPSKTIFSVTKNRVVSSRRFAEWLVENGIATSLVLHFHYDVDFEDLLIEASAELGSLLMDGIGEEIIISGNYPPEALRELVLSILQGAGKISYKAEFVSCPGCGRTLFDLQKVAKEIKKRTSHLVGVKIAIMGCIVNGPGEMADADFGYVGSGPNKIDLYVGKECVEKGIESSEAVDRLIALIQKQGRWIHPEQTPRI